MSFDDEIDAARKRLLDATVENPVDAFDDLAALQGLMTHLREKITSRRLAFSLSDGLEDEDDAVLVEITHTQTEEVIGIIVADNGEFVFESDFADYFDDFVEEAAEEFVARLYEVLRAGLPEYEIDQGETGED